MDPLFVKMELIDVLDGDGDSSSVELLQEDSDSTVSDGTVLRVSVFLLSASQRTAYLPCSRICVTETTVSLFRSRAIEPHSERVSRRETIYRSLSMRRT